MREVRSLLIVILSLGASACVSGTVSPSMRYAPSSYAYVKRIPVSAEIAVDVPSFSVDGAARAQTERTLVADSLRTSLEADLGRNGPLWLEPKYPKVRVEVTVDVTTKGDTTAWRYLPPWLWSLLGLPTYATDIVLTGSMRVLAGTAVLTTVAARAECTSHTGLYYNWNVELGCAAGELMEKMRKRLGEDSAKILAAPGKEPAADRAVIAVLDVEDGTGQLGAARVDQLSDYIVARVVEQGRFRVVPRNAVSKALEDMKVKSFRGGKYDEAQQIELGKAVAAKKMLATKIMRAGATCMLSATLYDLVTETSEKGVTAKAPCDVTALTAAVDELVRQIGS